MDHKELYTKIANLWQYMRDNCINEEEQELVANWIIDFNESYIDMGYMSFSSRADEILYHLIVKNYLKENDFNKFLNINNIKVIYNDDYTVNKMKMAINKD